MQLSNRVRYTVLGVIALIVSGLIVLAVFKFTPIGDSQPATKIASKSQSAADPNSSNEATKAQSNSSPATASATAAPAQSGAGAASTTLADSGPGSVLLLFIVVASFATAAHSRFALRRVR